MPVLIAAQRLDLDIAREVAGRLRASGGEVRCYLEDDDYELREMGCKIAVGLLDDAYNLAGALTNVHTFMPLMPDALTWKETATVSAVGTAWAAAAAEAEIEQTILAVSSLGEHFASVEEAFLGAVEPLAIIRTWLLVGGDRPLKEGHDMPAVALSIQRLAEVLSSADDRENLTGRWSLEGWATSIESYPGLTHDLGTPPGNSAVEAFLPEVANEKPREE